VGMDSRDLAEVETDVRGATESRRERAQQWAVDQLDDFLETLSPLHYLQRTRLPSGGRPYAQRVFAFRDLHEGRSAAAKIILRP